MGSITHIIMKNAKCREICCETILVLKIDNFVYKNYYSIRILMYSNNYIKICKEISI